MTPAQSIPMTLLPITVIARETGYSRGTVQLWLKDPKLCPRDIRAWLRRRAMQMAEDPAPRSRHSPAGRKLKQTGGYADDKWG